MNAFTPRIIQKYLEVPRASASITPRQEGKPQWLQDLLKAVEGC